MYLGTIYLSTKFRPEQTSNMAARWPSWGKKQSAITPELLLKKYGRQVAILGKKTKCYTPELLLKVTEVKVQNVTISLYVSLLFDLEYSNIVLICTVYISTKFRPDQNSSIAARWSPWKHTFVSGLRSGRIYLWNVQVCTLPELITFSLSIITFSLSLVSRTTVEVSCSCRWAHGPWTISLQNKGDDMYLNICNEKYVHTSGSSNATVYS
jgi:hypothetical protein